MFFLYAKEEKNGGLPKSRLDKPNIKSLKSKNHHVFKFAIIRFLFWKSNKYSSTSRESGAVGLINIIFLFILHKVIKLQHVLYNICQWDHKKIMCQELRVGYRVGSGIDFGCSGSKIPDPTLSKFWTFLSKYLEQIWTHVERILIIIHPISRVLFGLFCHGQNNKEIAYGVRSQRSNDFVSSRSFL